MTKIPAVNFLETVRANVNNDLLTDAEFREFMRVTLPIVERVGSITDVEVCTYAKYDVEFVAPDLPYPER